MERKPVVTADEFAERLRLMGHSVKKAGAEYSTPCPAHDDSKPSLSFRDGDTRLVVRCHAGCSFEDVERAARVKIGQQPFALREGQSSIPKKRRRSANQGSKKAPPQGVGEVYFVYRDENRTSLSRVAKKPNKTWRQDYTRDGGETWWVGSPQENGLRRVLYNLPEIMDADASAAIYFVEGEKDADTMMRAGLLATWIQGARAGLPADMARLLAARAVRLIPDNDAAGAETARSVERAIRAMGGTGSIAVMQLPEGIKDPTELWERDPDRGRFLATLAECPSVTSLSWTQETQDTQEYAREQEGKLVSISSKSNIELIGAVERSIQAAHEDMEKHGLAISANPDPQPGKRHPFWTLVRALKSEAAFADLENAKGRVALERVLAAQQQVRPEDDAYGELRRLWEAAPKDVEGGRGPDKEAMRTLFLACWLRTAIPLGEEPMQAVINEALSNPIAFTSPDGMADGYDYFLTIAYRLSERSFCGRFFLGAVPLIKSLGVSRGTVYNWISIAESEGYFRKAREHSVQPRRAREFEWIGAEPPEGAKAAVN